METKYPHITVRLTGTDGNAWAVLGAVNKALHENGIPKAEIDAFFDEATSGDNDHLMQTVMRWVEVE